MCTSAAVWLDGCALVRSKEDVGRLQALGLIGGHVSVATEADAPVIVVLSASPPAGVIDSVVLNRPGAYFFAVPPGTYQVAAFVDRNRDFTYQPAAEPAAYYGAPTPVAVGRGQKAGAVDIQIPAEPHGGLDLPIAVGNLGRRGAGELPPIQIGDVVTLDDPRFNPKNGEHGLWQPVDFLFTVGAGFYFLEPFSPKKVPVLFVHGAGGTPGDWRYLIEHLDRSTFQPWVVYYPSGMDLDFLARGFARWMSAIAARYELQRFIIVAHSMGGLVSRAAINDMADRPVGAKLVQFVTISSPWNGYGAAASGGEPSPTVVPTWVDMAPGSQFLERMFRTPLPTQCPYYLLFSYGGYAPRLRDANDGVVALSSELALPAQHTAKKVYGFDASHMSILRSAEVSQTLNTLLAGAVQ
jgi:pimeloyl-ACP methyl ester carboxylesterase